MVDVTTSLWCTVCCFYFWTHERTSPLPIHSKVFLHIFFKLDAHGVSHNLSHWIAALPTGIYPDQSPSSVFSFLLQQPPGWLLFLGIFGRGRGLEYRSASVYTHSEQSVTEWMRESLRERGSVACLPCILASRSIPTAMLPSSCYFSMDLSMLFGHLFGTNWSKLLQHSLVDCLLAVDFAQASSTGAQSVPALRFSVKLAAFEEN